MSTVPRVIFGDYFVLLAVFAALGIGVIPMRVAVACAIVTMIVVLVLKFDLSP